MFRVGLVAWVVLVDQSLPFLQAQELVLCEVVILVVLVVMLVGLVMLVRLVMLVILVGL